MANVDGATVVPSPYFDNTPHTDPTMIQKFLGCSEYQGDGITWKRRWPPCPDKPIISGRGPSFCVSGLAHTPKLQRMERLESCQCLPDTTTLQQHNPVKKYATSGLISRSVGWCLAAIHRQVAVALKHWAGSSYAQCITMPSDDTNVPSNHRPPTYQAIGVIVPTVLYPPFALTLPAEKFRWFASVAMVIRPSYVQCRFQKKRFWTATQGPVRVVYLLIFILVRTITHYDCSHFAQSQI